MGLPVWTVGDNGNARTLLTGVRSATNLANSLSSSGKVEVSYIRWANNYNPGT